MGDVGNIIAEKSKTPCTLALRDYFLYWKSHDMTSAGGKPFFFKCSIQSRTHELFFDDNIRYSDAFIVHPVDMSSPGKRQWPTMLLQTHMCRAEPLEFIFDKQYFVKQVARLEHNYNRKLIARKRLIKCMKAAHYLVRSTSYQEEAGQLYDAW